MIKRFILAASLTLAAANASAAVHTYAFTASIDSLYSSGELTSTPGPDGSTVALGQQLRGWFSYDDAAEAIFGHAGRDATHVVFEGNAWAGYVMEETALSYSGSGRTTWVDLTSNSPQYIDTFTIHEETTGWGISFEDASGTMFARGFPRGILSLDRLSLARLSDGWLRPDGSYVDMRATLTSLAPVPEPATWGMLLAGLGMLGLAARRTARPGADRGRG